MNIYKTILLGSSILLSACSNDTTSGQKVLTPSSTSPLTPYMDRQKVCSILDTKSIQKIMQLKSQIKTKVENYGGFYNCEYSWEGSEYGRFTLSLSIYDKSREVFPPKRLSVSELDDKIDEIVAEMDKRNKSKNKMAYDYAKKAIIAEERAANDFEVLNGIGDSAVLMKNKSESILTTVVENTKLKISMENSFNLTSIKPPRSESAKQIAELILKGN